MNVKHGTLFLSDSPRGSTMLGDTLHQNVSLLPPLLALRRSSEGVLSRGSLRAVDVGKTVHRPPLHAEDSYLNASPDIKQVYNDM